jgi:hypothetical protein
LITREAYSGKETNRKERRKKRKKRKKKKKEKKKLNPSHGFLSTFNIKEFNITKSLVLSSLPVLGNASLINAAVFLKGWLK